MERNRGLEPRLHGLEGQRAPLRLAQTKTARRLGQAAGNFAL